MTTNTFVHTLLVFFTFSSNSTQIRIFTKDEQNYKLYRKAKGNPNVYKILKTYTVPAAVLYTDSIYVLTEWI